MTIKFVRVECHTPESTHRAGKKIIHYLGRSGRRGVLEAIASLIEEDILDSETRYTIASWLRDMAAKDYQQSSH